MTNITQGMNVEEVRRLGADLQAFGDKLDQLAKVLEHSVTAVAWRGPDAAAFKNQWWPDHRSRIASMANELRGFGQSAKNNAEEQERASGVAGGTTSAGAGAIGGSSPGPSAPSSGGVLPGSGRTWEEVDAAYRGNAAKFGMGSYGPGGEYRYQCTAWAMFRWRELGYTGPIGDGHGWQKAGLNGGSTSTPPSLGAMASYGNGQRGSYGHVMIVEEVSTSQSGAEQIRVSEWNVKDLDYENGHPNEYSSDRIFTRNPDGTWSVDGRNVGAITFAGLPR